MAFVEVACFLDLTEAQVAASALRASGIDVMLGNEVLGQMDINLQLAIGGIRLLVPESDARAARTFLDQCRAQPSELEPLPAPESTIRAVLSLALTLWSGNVTPLRPRRPSRLVD